MMKRTSFLTPYSFTAAGRDMGPVPLSLKRDRNKASFCCLDQTEFLEKKSRKASPMNRLSEQLVCRFKCHPQAPYRCMLIDMLFVMNQCLPSRYYTKPECYA